MRLHELVKMQGKSKKRVGRGLGSGLGKTAGRGTKGQKARGKIPVGFSSGLAFYKKLPRKKGQGNAKISVKPNLVQVSELNVFKNKEVVDINALVEAKIISLKDRSKGVKILSKGEITKPLTVKLPLSKNARLKIVNMGGNVLNV